MNKRPKIIIVCCVACVVLYGVGMYFSLLLRLQSRIQLQLEGFTFERRIERHAACLAGDFPCIDYDIFLLCSVGWRIKEQSWPSKLRAGRQNGVTDLEEATGDEGQVRWAIEIGAFRSRMSGSTK